MKTIFRFFSFLSRKREKLRKKFRKIYYQTLFASCGRKLQVGKDIILTCPEKINAGNNLKLKDRVILRAAGGVTIGDDVTISSLACILTTSLQIADGKILDKHVRKEIRIGNNVWICSGAIILGGVTIGDHVVVAAGSVVNRDLESGYIYAGAPAKPVKKLI